MWEGCCTAGFAPAVLEVAGEATGAVYGLQNTFASVPGFMVPILSGSLTERYGDKHGFRVLFVVSFIVEMLAAVVWLGFATTKRDDALVASDVPSYETLAAVKGRAQEHQLAPTMAPPTGV